MIMLWFAISNGLDTTLTEVSLVLSLGVAGASVASILYVHQLCGTY